MRILIAPDKFKGSLSATEVAEAMTRGARAVHPDASFSLRPIGDGGEGTLDAFLVATGGREREVRVSGPLGDHVSGRIALLNGGPAVIEMADAAGLSLVDPTPLSALSAGTGGVGQLMSEAAGHDQLVVCVGGSASTDGGTGAARAWGWRFLDDRGHPLAPGGGELVALSHIEPPDELPSLHIIGACDVADPLIGDRGAAHRFGPQKGADPAAVELLERGLERLAEVVRADLDMDISEIAHGGAGGGMGAGLGAFFGATLRPGLDLLAEVTGLESEIEAADLVLTGEGRMDPSSLSGKAPVGVAKMAMRLNTPCVAVVGDLQVERQRMKRIGIADAVGLIQSGGGSLAETDPERAIEKATEGILRIRQEKSQGRSFRRRGSFRS